MGRPELLVIGFGAAFAGLVLLARGLLSPRQVALAIGGVACGTAIGVACIGAGHG